LKVLGILGGANRDGNTAKLVEEVLLGANESGHETVLIRLVDEKIGHIGYRGGKSIFPRDDFEKIKLHLETMGAIVFGAPIWYSTLDSRTHTFIQRLYYYSGYYSDENRKKWPKGVKAVNIITYAQSDPHYYDRVLEWLKAIEKDYGMKSIKEIIAEDTSEKPVQTRRELLRRAHNIGKKL
jgi:multimeric flavodoxin WrbA